MIVLDGLVPVNRQGAKARCLAVGEEFPQGVCQGRLVILDGQQIVPAPVENLLGNLGLAADGIHRDDTGLECQRLEQRLDGRNLVAFATGMFLGQTQAASRNVGADRVQCGVMAIPRTAGGLSVNRYQVCHDANEPAYPGTETGLEHLGIQQAEHPAKGVVGWGAVLKNQVALQPRFVILGPFGNIHPTVRSTRHGAQRHQDHFRQIVPLRRPRARIIKARKGLRWLRMQLHCQGITPKATAAIPIKLPRYWRVMLRKAAR